MICSGMQSSRSAFVRRSMPARKRRRLYGVRAFPASTSGSAVRRPDLEPGRAHRVEATEDRCTFEAVCIQDQRRPGARLLGRSRAVRRDVFVSRQLSHARRELIERDVDGSRNTVFTEDRFGPHVEEHDPAAGHPLSQFFGMNPRCFRWIDGRLLGSGRGSRWRGRRSRERRTGRGRGKGAAARLHWRKKWSLSRRSRGSHRRRSLIRGRALGR